MATSRILWGEGLFLRPQHFQQQDEYAESLTRTALLTAQPLAWGIRELELDHESLKSGTLRVTRLDAVMPDGSFLRAPDVDQLPPALALESLVAEEGATEVHVAVHLLQPHGSNCVDSAEANPQARYLIERRAVGDIFTDAAETEVLRLSKLAVLKTGDEPRDQYVSLPLLRVRRTSSNGFDRDPAFAPPSLTMRSAPALQLQLRRLIDSLRAKAEALYGVHREPSKNVIEFRSGDIASFWLLHTVSSACAALTHLYRNADLHPERVFQEMLRLAGGLMTFSKGHTLDDLPAYEHTTPGACFGRLDTILRDLLDTVISTRYFSIPLSEPKPSFHLGRLESDKIDASTAFYLCVSASQSQAEIIESVPFRFKVGAPDDVEKLVLSAMSGVRLTHAAQVPAAIPIRPGASYFELNPHGSLYERMLKAQSMMIYTPDIYSDLKLELIAVTQ